MPLKLRVSDTKKGSELYLIHVRRLFRQPWFAPGVVFIIAISARIIYWEGCRASPSSYIDSDANNYFLNGMWLSKHWDVFLSSSEWHQWHGWIKAPLYYIFLALSSLVTGESIPALRLLQVVLDSATAVLMYFLARELFGSRAGWVSGIAYAIYLEFVMMSCTLVTENLFLFLLAATFWALIRVSKSGSTRAVLASGLLAGLTALCRPVMLPFMPIAAIWLFIVLQKEGFKWQKAAGLVALLTIATSITTVPWMIRNSILFHRPFALDNMAALNMMLSHPFPELDKWDIGPNAYLKYPKKKGYKRRLWKWPSLEKEFPLSPGRIIQVTFEPSIRNMKMITNKAQQILRPRLTRFYYNYPPRYRSKYDIPDSLIVIFSDVLFLSASLLILFGIALKMDKRSALLLAWILLQIFFLSVIFRPTPNYNMRRYSLPFLFAALPFIYPGIQSFWERHGSGRRLFALVLICTWLLLVVPPIVRWFTGEEMWVHKGLEIMFEQ